MFGGEYIAPVFCRKLLAIIKRHLQRRIVRMQEHIWNDDFAVQVGTFARVSRVLVSACVPPWPPVKSAVLHVGDVIRNQVVASASRSLTEHHSSPVSEFNGQ